MEESKVYSRQLAFCVGVCLVSAAIFAGSLFFKNHNVAILVAFISGYTALSFFGVVLAGRGYCKRWKFLNWVLKNSNSKPENKVLTWSEEDLETYFEGLSQKEQEHWLALLKGLDFRKLTVSQRKNLELIKEILNA